MLTQLDCDFYQFVFRLSSISQSEPEKDQPTLSLHCLCCADVVLLYPWYVYLHAFSWGRNRDFWVKVSPQIWTDGHKANLQPISLSVWLLPDKRRAAVTVLCWRDCRRLLCSPLVVITGNVTLFIYRTTFLLLSNTGEIARCILRWTSSSLFHSIIWWLQEHPSVCELSRLDNEHRLHDGMETAVFQRCHLLLRWTEQMCSSLKWQAESKESNGLLLHHCPHLSYKFIIIMRALHCTIRLSQRFP